LVTHSTFRVTRQFRGRPTHKQVENYVRDDHVEGAEVDQAGGEVAAVRLPVVVAQGAVRRLDHAVVHDLVPILAGDDPEEHGHPGDG